jgi:hypothetical protein
MGFTDLNKSKKTDGSDDVFIKGPTSHFGEILTVSPVPVAQGEFVYNFIALDVFNTGSFSGADINASSGMAELSSSTNVSGSALLELRRGLKYRPGQGSLMRATALFDTPVENNRQLVGISNREAGYTWGYDGTNFGVLHTQKGQVEIRKYVVSAGANTEAVTVTLDGESTVVNLVGGGDTTQTAYQLASQDYSDVGYGWTADVVGSTVYFLSSQPRADLDGTYSIAGTAINGTFSQVVAGSGSTETFIPTGSFNNDKLDGTGPSGMVLNPQKGNVYQVGFQYLGYGNARFDIEDPNTGIFIKAHELKLTNSRTTPVVKNPQMRPSLESCNRGNNTNVVLKTASMASFTEGIIRNLDPKFSKAVTFASANDNDFLDQPILAIKTNSVFRDQTCAGEFDLLAINCSNENTAKTLTVGFFLNEPIGGDVNFEYVDENISMVSTAVLTPGVSTIANLNAIPFYTFSVAPLSAVTINLEPLAFVFPTNSTLIIAFKSAQSIAGNLSLNWFEQQ